MQTSIKRLKRIYYGMKSRCLSTDNPAYCNYGGRGIGICEEWLNSADSFIVWALSNGYADNLSLDRVDVNGDYEPKNCRWVTQKIQANNRRHYWLPDKYPEFSYEGLPDEREDVDMRKSIKERLEKNALTQAWLINRLEEEGLNTDKTEMSSVLAGTRKGAKAETIIKLADAILSKYDDAFEIFGK